MKNILLYIWQLPQNLLGLLLLLFYKVDKIVDYKDKKIRVCKNFSGGISLGNYIIVCREDQKMIMHEYGHTLQSKMLGPLYLIVIGLPSLVWAALYGPIIPWSKNGYYKFYTEKWADKLGEVKR